MESQSDRVRAIAIDVANIRIQGAESVPEFFRIAERYVSGELSIEQFMAAIDGLRHRHGHLCAGNGFLEGVISYYRKLPAQPLSGSRRHNFRVRDPGIGPCQISAKPMTVCVVIVRSMQAPAPGGKNASRRIK
jgi:hypothetical protein